MHGYMDIYCSAAKENEYVSTMKGRRRYIPDINSRNSYQRAAAERQAINSVIQGSASELIKLAMLCIQQAINQQYKEVHLAHRPYFIMQIHDELIFEYNVPSNIDMQKGVADCVSLIKQCMETNVSNFFNINVPLLVNICTSHNSWGEMQKYTL